MQHLKMGFKVQVLKIILSLSQCKLQKREFVKTVMSCTYVLYVRIIIRIVCAQARSVSLQSDIGNYWPGMYNTAFLVIFMDLCEQGPFWQCCHLHTKLFKNTKEKLFCFMFLSWECTFSHHFVFYFKISLLIQCVTWFIVINCDIY